VSRTVVASVRFNKVKRNQWECLECGSLVRGVEQHACWHASLNGGPTRPPRPSDGEREVLTIHVGESGWPLP
jgi:hypothetical protein